MKRKEVKIENNVECVVGALQRLIDSIDKKYIIYNPDWKGKGELCNETLELYLGGLDGPGFGDLKDFRNIKGVKEIGNAILIQLLINNS